jgi:hypothetical protein
MYRIARPLEDYVRAKYDDHSTVKVEVVYGQYVRISIHSRSDLLDRMTYTLGWPLDNRGKPAKHSSAILEDMFMRRAVSAIDTNVTIRSRNLR